MRPTLPARAPYPLILIILCLAAVFFNSCRRHQIDFSEHALRPGDLAFRRGIGTKSAVVATADGNGAYSHIGVVVATDSGFMIVHLTPGERTKGQKADTIKMETPEEFFASGRASKGEIARFGDEAVSDAAAGHASRLLEKKILFDHDYNLEDTTEMYCTELVWYAFSCAGADLTEGRRTNISGFGSLNGKHIFPSDIYDNDNIETVCAF